MAKAKNPKSGQGVGGGRPRTANKSRIGPFDVTPEGAALLRDATEATKRPAWQVIDDCLKIALADGAADTLPQRLAMDAASFLASHANSPGAPQAIERAWASALAMAGQQMRRPQSMGHTSGRVLQT